MMIKTSNTAEKEASQNISAINNEMPNKAIISEGKKDLCKIQLYNKDL